MIVAVILVKPVHVTVHEVVDVARVRYGLVSARDAVDVKRIV